jgi:superoxide dismutase, Fe-Mn family
MKKFVQSFLSGLAIAFITFAMLTAFPADSRAAVELPPLPYDYAALAPAIDAETMQLHHDKHHATYVTNLNAALEKHPELQSKSVEALLSNLSQVPEDIRKTVQNNGGGHINHSMFWTIMKPDGGGSPTGTLATAIQKTFGSYEAFQEQFNQAGLSQFGSGWVW